MLGSISSKHLALLVATLLITPTTCSGTTSFFISISHLWAVVISSVCVIFMVTIVVLTCCYCKKRVGCCRGRSGWGVDSLASSASNYELENESCGSDWDGGHYKTVGTDEPIVEAETGQWTIRRWESADIQIINRVPFSSFQDIVLIAGGLKKLLHFDPYYELNRTLIFLLYQFSLRQVS